MESHSSFSTIIAISFYVILLAFLLHVLNRKRKTNGKNNRKPPQAKGALPISGPELPQHVLGEMAEKHGPIFTIKLGVHEALVVTNASIAKACFTTNDKVFASRPKAEATKLMGYNYALFAFTPYGDYWRRMRKMVKHEILSPRQVEMFGPVRGSELKASLRDLYDGWVKNKISQNSKTVKVEMSQWFGNLVVNIMVRIITGKRFRDGEGVRFQNVVKTFAELMGAFVISDFIPYLNWLDVGGYRKAMKKTAIDLDNIFDGWLKEHKKESKSNKGILNTLISVLQCASEDEFPGFDHDTIIKSTCQQLLTAGLDTASGTLTWALALLLKNPKTLKIAQDEIDEQVGRERLVDESDMKKLVYLNSIIKETLRLYPAAPLLVPHESMENCIVGGYQIPKGTRLLVNIYKMHRDPNIWEDPLEFKPERSLMIDKHIDFRGNHYELLPFGGGRRICPGINFSVQAVSLILASLIQQFVLKNSSDEPIDMSESSGLTIWKTTPLEVLLAPRLSSNMY